jgi:RNA polymerase sigma factor (sigma-70 family)
VTAHLGERLTDAEIVALFQRDPERFTVVYDRYFRDIYRYAAGRLDVQEAEDIAAETFLVAFGHRDRFDPARGSLRVWLFGIATNLIARHRRKEARHYRAMARVGTEPTAGSHEDRVISSVTADQMQPELAWALATLLTRGERDVVLLVALAQLSHEDVAKALGISSGTVGSRLSRARRKLRAAIGQAAIDKEEVDE